MGILDGPCISFLFFLIIKIFNFQDCLGRHVFGRILQQQSDFRQDTLPSSSCNPLEQRREAEASRGQSMEVIGVSKTLPYQFTRCCLELDLLGLKEKKHTPGSQRSSLTKIPNSWRVRNHTSRLAERNR
ncbi:hypothetical protein AVEN_184060-1 [Araneus ventricosus]|uniref:Uncharacterized protein n=1 Tax=Araneus ventricosus TaxID=182803 RepID=A0A4Y2CZ16_ARAVE|nr:hypothetical protein AVEN_184060-1 [Araneus ventricosus]